LDGFVTRIFGDARPTKEQVAAMKKEHEDGVPRTNKLVQQLIVDAIGGIHNRQIVWGESQSDEVSRSQSLCLVFARSTLSSDNLH
jgi:hypothetical protein